MTLTLTLTSEEETWLQAQARRAGLTPEEYVQRLIGRDAQAPPRPEAGAVSPTMALFHRWSAEDATDDPVEIARRTQETGELLQTLANHPISFRIPTLPDDTELDQAEPDQAEPKDQAA